MDWEKLTEFRELWFPCPRIRLPELGPSGPIFVEGGRCVSGALGEYTKLWMRAAGHWHFYYIEPSPRDFFRVTMPEAIPHLLHPGEMTVETVREGRSYKVVLGLRCAEGPVRVLHLVGDVPDVTRALEDARRAGYTPIDKVPRPGAHGSRIAFLHPKDTHGVLIELVAPRS